jgi:hypothetical protein
MTEFFLQYWYWFAFGFWILLVINSFLWLHRKYFPKPVKYQTLRGTTPEEMRSWASSFWKKSQAKSTLFDRPGYDALWLWFGLSRASFLTLPRVLLHEMPDDWQLQMAKLLNEFDDYWDPGKMGSVGNSKFQVNLRRGNRNIPMPIWVLNHRHPDKELMESFKAKK